MGSRTDNHRRNKRRLEARLIVEILKKFWVKEPGEMYILEFGAGACDQVQYLDELGQVKAIDIYTHKDVAEKEVDFLECSITNTPFNQDQFDMIYSNHVLAHIGEHEPHDLKDAFDEMKRIGKPDCIYTFSVPTSLWLLLSVPTHYYLMISKLFKRLLPFKKKEVKDNNNISNNLRNSKRPPLLRLLLPQGLGIYKTFTGSFKAFQKRSWIKLFEHNGFAVMANYPLALYGASEFPVVPTTSLLNRFNIASSRVFILKKADQHNA